MILVVTGGRDFAAREALWCALDALHKPEHPISFMSLGDASGADAIALAWAKSRGVHGLVHRAHWDRLGKAAGHERNGRMIASAIARAEQTGEPAMCLAVPGGRGTADCVEQARVNGISVVSMDEVIAGEREMIGCEDGEDDGAYDGLRRDWGDL